MDDAEALGFEPRVIGFLCNWCSYAGADKAGAAQLAYPPNVDVIRVPCTGRIDPVLVLKAFEKGADGVLILACHPGDCHYKEGNLRAFQRHRILLSLLAQMGFEGERVKFGYVSASEGEKFREVISELVETLKNMGPINGRTLKNEQHHPRLSGA
jgi:F420-non-reducing hydrogenase iron-sulfur subunit